MKNILLLLLLAFAIKGYSQNAYQNVKTVSADGIIFEVELDEYSFILSNITNIYDDEANWRYKDGRELETLDEYEVVDCSMKPGGEGRAIREAFGDAVISSLRSYKHSRMTIFYVIGPNGDTLEVAFIMNPVPELVSLSPEVFAALERNLKKYVKWNVNAYGQQLEFFQVSTFIHFKNVPLDSELHKIKPDIEFDSDLDLIE